MKIGIITGASSGMGREAALQLAELFPALDQLWIIARREDRLRELEKQIPQKVRCFGLDLTSESDLDRLEQALKEADPDVKFLINSAGYGKIGAIGSLDRRDECGMIRLNCEALCSVTHLVLPYLSYNSRILMFASAAAFLPQPDFAIYAATKSFVLSYSRALNEELRDRDISVTAVCPGPVRTEFFDIAETTGQIPLYKHLLMANPRSVVRKALRDCIMKKELSVYGLTMKFFFLLSKVMPHKWGLYFMRKL